MEKILFWRINSVNNKHTLHRLQQQLHIERLDQTCLKFPK